MFLWQGKVLKTAFTNQHVTLELGGYLFQAKGNIDHIADNGVITVMGDPDIALDAGTGIKGYPDL